MKVFKRVLALMAIAMMLLTMAACGAKDTLVVGITDFAPMDYQNEVANGSAMMQIWPRPLQRPWVRKPSL